ncbi:phosphatidylserine decarboxylase [Sulfurospirillum barnesii]|uniref:phosphatidylserine decarboxylase n=1 Tax=Sulfurospirillum barnesii (strain ATCC 700032 / DSM 10660 / SES-3) TaxID=760154 RepID=I3XVZ3_SULBS|nr:phosphatidylserine decarboxylase [Sulfurospirillum barnesii]AFL68117.1 phosphatidylserine decarboxylase precursor [Sulfurospirillum barnesii SES-3]
MQRYPKFKSSIASRLFGVFASKEFPTSVQTIINKSYVSMMRVDLGEFEEADHYKSLNKLFTRPFKTKRLFSMNEQTLISPCDSLISAYGKIEHSLALQIKGFTYSVRELLGDYIAKKEKDRLEGGDFVNFYLSPRDYHRYHVPLEMRVAKAVHIPGKLYPVNFKWLRKIEGLFVENERVVLECYTKENQLFYMVFVGALNVGKMAFNFDKTIQTNAKGNLQQCYSYDNLWLKKGEELGMFEMGSTIVMLFEKESISLELESVSHVKFGQTLGALRGKSTHCNTEAIEQGDASFIH